MTNPLITVIVPIYNTEKYLEKCLNSILFQTYTNLEILLVNDGSTDNSMKICDEIVLCDKRVKVIHCQNGGQGFARNLALDIANGDYIGFVDSDDWIENDMYEFLLSLAHKTQSDIVGCGNYKVSFDDQLELCEEPGDYQFTNFEAFEALVNSNKILNTSVCNKLFRASLLKEIRFPTVRAYEDDEFIYKAFYFSNKIYQSSIPKYYYLIREQSTMTSKFNVNKLALCTIQKNIEEFSKVYCPKYYNKLMKTTSSKQMYCYYQLTSNKEIDPNGEIRNKLRNEILSDYKKYLSNPIIGKNKYMLWMFKNIYFLSLFILKLYFRKGDNY